MSNVGSGISRLSIRHETVFQYESQVSSSYNELRMTPKAGVGQTVLDSRLTVDPVAWVREYTDYFGSTVHVVEITAPHTVLTITNSALVEASPDRPGPSAVIDWADLSEPDLRRNFLEYLTLTKYTSVDGRLSGVAEGFRRELAPAEAVQAASDWIREELAYEPGVTEVHTTGLEALKAGMGVCQDFAHVGLALLRELGIPARYVSGYLHPQAEPAIGEAVIGESHAWVQAWLGDWVDLDPTNGRPVGAQHVRVGTGRDYFDVAPVRGVVDGGGRAVAFSRVALTRVF